MINRAALVLSMQASSRALLPEQLWKPAVAGVPCHLSTPSPCFCLLPLPMFELSQQMLQQIMSGGGSFSQKMVQVRVHGTAGLEGIEAVGVRIGGLVASNPGAAGRRCCACLQPCLAAG